MWRYAVYRVSSYGLKLVLITIKDILFLIYFEIIQNSEVTYKDQINQ